MCIISLRCKQNNPYLERNFNVLSRGQFYALILAVWLLMASENAGLSVYIKIPVTPPKQTLHAQAQKSETLFTLLDLPCHSPWALCSDRPGFPGVFFTREVSLLVAGPCLRSSGFSLECEVFPLPATFALPRNTRNTWPQVTIHEEKQCTLFWKNNYYLKEQLKEAQIDLGEVTWANVPPL